MQVQIFAEKTKEKLQDDVNSFLEHNGEIRDIEYQTTPYTEDFDDGADHGVIYSALISYEKY